MTPLILDSALIDVASGSKKIVNNSGLRLHPYLVDLVILKNWDIIPLVKTAALGLEYKTFIHLQKPSPNPNFERVANKKAQSTLSNAFWASSDMAETGWGLVLFIQLKCNSLLMLSDEDLCFINPTWSLWIILGRTWSNLSANVLDNILQSTFIRLIEVYNWLGPLNPYLSLVSVI